MKPIHRSGTRKSAIARATLKSGKGTVRVNKRHIEIFEPLLQRMKMMEPLLIAGESAQKVNIDVSVHGGGFNAQRRG